jgi:hypothetical protein
MTLRKSSELKTVKGNRVDKNAWPPRGSGKAGKKGSSSVKPKGVNTTEPKSPYAP